MNRRRTIIGFLACGPLVTMQRSHAQPAGKVFLVGYLNLLSSDPESPGGQFFRGLRDRLAERGYVLGRNIAFDEKYANGQADRLPRLAAELVQSNVDVIVAGPAVAIRAASDATNKIPIVMAFSADDPVKSGFVKSLNHPGTNVTGVTAQGRDLAPKLVEHLLEFVPGVRHVAVLMNPAAAEHGAYFDAMQTRLPAGIRLQRVEAGQPRQYEDAFATMKSEHAEALVILGNAIFTQDSRQLASLALSHKLPSIYLYRTFPDEGGLMSYGPDHREIFELASEYVDKILKGTNPGMLPVRQPTKFELIVNERTAKALGLSVPRAVLARANEVIR